MNSPVLIAIVAATPGLVGAWFAYKQAVRAAQITTANESLKIESGAYERARVIYEAGIQELERQVTGLRKEVSDERNTTESLRKRINELELTIAKMRAEMVRAGINIDIGHSLSNNQSQDGNSTPRAN